MYRVHSSIDLYTATGRMNFNNPCLQNIPRDFEISGDRMVSESMLKVVEFDDMLSKNVLASGSSACADLIDEDAAMFFEKINEQPTRSKHTAAAENLISLRNLFVASKSNVLLSVDYCQLELRIIANLCKDETLVDVFNGDPGQDVFKLLASKWLNVPVDQVDEAKRQNVKKVIYGIIYGISPKTLAVIFNSTENEASGFIESFKSTFPGLKRFIHKQIDDCRSKGYIETIRKRRRYLPNINATDNKQKSHVKD
jgi:DNA polymerase I-like protein with 3'-5' exonuclease and polymerase domains